MSHRGIIDWRCSVCGGDRGVFGMKGVRYCREHVPRAFWRWRDGPDRRADTTDDDRAWRDAPPVRQGRLL